MRLNLRVRIKIKETKIIKFKRARKILCKPKKTILQVVLKII